MTIKFNLWDEPWIPVLMLSDSSRKELSLYDAISRAHEIKEIRDENPVFEIGTYRLLIAIVMHAYKITDTAHIRDLLSKGSFDKSVLDSYKRTYYDHFDLFGAEKRFYQFSKVEGKLEGKSVAEIILDLPKGTNSILFHHTYEDELTLSPKICARGLCAVSAYSLAGGRGYQPSAAGSPPIYTLIYGSNLFELLLYNSCPDNLLNNPSTNGPAWTLQDDIGKKEYKIDEISVLLGLTWQPRSIHLLPKVAEDESEFICSYTGEKTKLGVSSVYFMAGWSYNKDGAYTDPHCAYIQNKDKLTALQLKEDKAFWRFMGPLFLASGESDKRPMTINQYVWNFMAGSRAEIRFLSYALATDGKAKIFKWAKEMFVIPKEILSVPDKANFLIKSISESEVEGINLGNAVLVLDEQQKQSNKRKALWTLKAEILQKYWYETELLFRTYLIPRVTEFHGIDFTELDYEWAKILRKTARNKLRILEQILTKPKDFKQYEKCISALIGATYKSFPILKQMEEAARQANEQADGQAAEQAPSKPTEKKAKPKKTTQQPLILESQNAENPNTGGQAVLPKIKKPQKKSESNKEAKSE